MLSCSLLVTVSATTRAAIATTDTQPPPADHATAPAGENATAVVAEFERHYGTVETLSMTVDTETRVGDRSYATTTTVYLDRDRDRLRAAHETPEGTVVTVVNETGTVTYDADANVVRRSNRSFTDWSAIATAKLTQVLDRTNVTVTDRERTDNATAYRFATGRSAGEGRTTVSVRLNTSTQLPTAARLRSEPLGVATTARVRNLTVNEPIPSERFSVAVPDDAREREPSPTVPRS